LATAIRRLPDDSTGSIVLGWLVRLTAVLGLVGIVAFDAIAIGVAKLGTTDGAALTARAAQDQFDRTGDLRVSQQVADATATELGLTLVAYEMDRKGGVTLTVSRVADTIVLARIGPLQDWAYQEATLSRPPQG
jgi:hypothetical protein